MNAILFIDANQYLDLHGLNYRKKLLDLLKQKKTYIFISAQIDDEVLRNKHQFARKIFSARLNKI